MKTWQTQDLIYSSFGPYFSELNSLIDWLIDPVTVLSSWHDCATVNVCRDLYLDGNELQSQGVIDLVHILVQQAVKDDEDRQEDTRIKTIEAIQAAALGLHLLIWNFINFLLIKD